jgi:cell division transport system permease protein
MKGAGSFARQIGRHFRREKRLSIGSFLVLIIVLILVDLFWIASASLNRQYANILRSVKMELFINNALPDSALSVIENTLLTFEGVELVTFVSKDEAARILESDLGMGILDELDENPLPRSFILHFDHVKNLDALDAMQSQLLNLEGVDTIEYNRSWIRKVENVGHNLRVIGYGVGGLILIVVLLTMANTNRLTARSKSRDFEQLKLLGAGPSYLVYPFLAEGFLSAIVAAAIGWGFLYYLGGKVTFTAFSIIQPDIKAIAIYAFSAGLTGMAGAYLGIRRLLLS